MTDGKRFRVGDVLSVYIPVGPKIWQLDYRIMAREHKRVLMTDGRNLKGMWFWIKVIDGDEYVQPFGRGHNPKHLVKATHEGEQ